MELYFLARCAQMMLLKQCIRRAVQEGLVRHFPINIHAMLFFHQIQFILQCPPSWRALQLLNLLHLVDRRSMWVRWSGRILNGHVLRRVGLQCEPKIVFSIYTITYISSFIPACRILHMERWLALPAAHRRWNRSRTPTSADWIQNNVFF